MYLPLRAWKEAVASFLGSGQKPRSKQKRRPSRYFRLESLEDRRMMSATLYWDPSGAIAAHGGNTSYGGGNGTWNSTNVNWYETGVGDVTWNTSDTAAFTGSGGTVTVASGMSAGEVDFLTSGVTLQSGSLAITGTGTVDVASSDTATASLTLNGSNGLTLTGGGGLVLTGSSSYTGGTTLDAGTLTINSDAALGTAPGSPTTNITFAGNSTLQFTSAFSLNANRSITIDSGFTGTFDSDGNVVSSAGVISGSGNLTVDDSTGAGTLSLSGSNTYTGATAISNGTLQLASSGALGSTSGVSATSTGTLDLDGQSIGSASTDTLSGFDGTIINSDLSTAATLASYINNGATTTSFTVGGSGDLKFTGIIGGGSYATTMVVGMSTGATLTLSNSGTGFVGNLTVNSGTVHISGYVAEINVFSGTGGVITAPTTPNGFLEVGMDNGSGNYSGSIQGHVGIFKYGTGTQELSGSNTFTRGIDIEGGTVQAGSSTALGSGGLGIALVSTGATLDLNGYSVTTAGGVIVDTTGTSIINSSAMAAGLSSAINMQSYGLTVQENGNLTLSGVISGTGALTESGPGTLILSGTNTYTGGTVIDGGTVSISSDSNLGAAPGSPATNITFTGGGGTLQFTSNLTLSSDRSMVIDSGAAAYLDTDGNNDSYAGAISGGGGLVAYDSTFSGGSLTLSGTNTYSGGTMAYGATLVLGSSNAIPTNSDFSTFVGGSLNMNGYNASISDLESLTGDGTIYNLSGSDSILTVQSGNFAGEIYDTDNPTGTLALVKNGAGSLTLSDTNYYSGGTTINNGTIYSQNGQSLGYGNVVVNSGGTLDLDGTGLTIGAGFDVGALSGGGLITNTGGTAATLYLDQSGPSTFSGTIADGSGSGDTLALEMDGSGTITLTGSNSFSGGTTISNGTVAINSDAALGTAPSSPMTNITFTGDATLEFLSTMTLNANRTIYIDAGVTATLDLEFNTVTFFGSFAGGGTYTTINNGTFIT